MNKFERQVLQYVQQERLFEPGDRLVIACSGGVDSMALLSFCLKLQDVELIVAHVDHMLRGEQSHGDLQFVEQFCRQHDVTFTSARIDIPALYEEQGGNLQTLCRNERYRFLAQVMQQNNASKLLTAHHADDQLESVLMAIMKSSSVTSLQGIKTRRPFADGEIIRPFFMVTKTEIRGYLQEIGVSYREDASNGKDNYLRNRVRHHVIPLLEAENNQVSRHAVQLTQQLSEDELYMQQEAQQLFPKFIKENSDGTYEIEIEAFVRIAVALQRRVVLILLNYIYSDANTFQSYTLCKAILSLLGSCDGSAEVHLPQGMIARRQYAKLIVGPKPTVETIGYFDLKLNEWNEFNGVRVYIGEASNVSTLNTAQSAYYFSRAFVTFPLRIRTRQQGDQLVCLGMTQPKKLARIFIDDKIPLQARDGWPLLIDNNNEILALLGIRVSTIFSKQKRVDDDFVLITERLHN